MKDRASFFKLIQAFSEPYRGTVYHYTSADGVAGIIDNHEIWMSNAAFTNDTTDLRMLDQKNAQDILKDNDFTNDSVKLRWHEILERQRLSEEDKNYFYMASFSRKKDMLEQWRAYGSFCIGFDAKKLSVRRKVPLYRCLYTKNDIRRWILNKEKIDEWKGVTDTDEREAAAYYLFSVAEMKYKNEHFRSEKEFRLITASQHNWFYNNSPEMYEDDLPIHFRRHPVYGSPVPYVKFFIEQDHKSNANAVKEKEMEMKARKLKEEGTKERGLLPITEVIVYPMAHQEEAKAACKILLAEKGYKNVKVSNSNIPYRGI